LFSHFGMGKLAATGEDDLASPDVPESVVRFGQFAADLEAGELRRDGMKVKLQGQPFEVLALLLKRPGRVVTREELRRRLWPSDTFVDFEHGLNAAVNRLREALGDSAEEPRFIETVPRRGYRFVAAGNAVAARGTWAASKQLINSYFHSGTLRSAVVGACVVLAIAVGTAFWTSIHKRRVLVPSSGFKIFPLTGAFGAERQPAFSPDGKQIAYLWQGDDQRNLNLYVKLIGAGRPLRLTHNAEQEACPVWSPDGRYIAFLRATERGNDVYLVPALGGSERRLTQSYTGYLEGCLSWSPDGTLLAVPDKTSPNEPVSIFFVSVKDAKRWKVTLPPVDYLGDSYPAFSPEGQALAFVRHRGGGDTGADNDIFLQEITGQAMPKIPPRRLTFDSASIMGLNWTPDGHSVVFSSMRSGSARLWRINRETSAKQEPQPVAGSDEAGFPSIASTGRLAYQQLKHAGFISRWDLSMAGKSRVPSRFCPSSQGDVSPQFSPDGSKVVFASRRSGSFELWLCKSDGSNPIQLTSLGGFSGSPMWSPDGQRIAFDNIQGGKAEIRVVNLDQSPPLRVTSGESNAVRPTWSGDGKWIYFASDATGEFQFQVWKIPAEGGRPVQVTRHGGWEGRESPDGKYVFYVKFYPDWLTNPGRNPGIWKVPIGGGEETLLLKQGKPGLWTVSQRGIYLLNPSPRGVTVDLFNFATDRITQLTVLPEYTDLDTLNPSFTVSPDARTMLYDQIIFSGNIMVVENFR
jgi:Tol biopolymer transport system component/DNA-binding winged helix-turn-helix (wHTH) protein